MTRSNQPINSHVEEYLDYYCGLSYAPEFAVLLKGQWGSGKTWFINRYCEKLKRNNKQCLYISLYGIASLSDIDEKFLQLLHPFWKSKGVAITEKIIKGLLKTSLRIDLNNDGRDEGTWNIQIPEINLPKHLEGINESILIFDDLERCNIDLGTILGYINHFVEHQESKVILVANEDQLFKNGSYKDIKEKLIGKTFGVSPDFEGALENFITNVDNLEVGRFLSDNTELIEDLYDRAEYENLRNLKQIVLDFKRIFVLLPEKVKGKPELLQDLLRFLMAFSIEVKRGAMSAKDVSKLLEEYNSGELEEYKSSRSKQLSLPQTPNLVVKDNSEEKTSLQKILDRYTTLTLHDPFPSILWWQTFLDKGVIDLQELEQSVSDSKYFQDEKTPGWVRLWHFSDLFDDDFNTLLAEIESEYDNRKFLDLGVIIHITGLFLYFSDAGIYHKTRTKVLKDSKLYIDYLKNTSQLEPSSQSVFSSDAVDYTSGSYLRLGFQGKELEEFKEFYSYVEEVQELARAESMPRVGQSLLSIMQSDVWKFHGLICLTNSQEYDEFNQKYYKVPILKYVEPSAFTEKLLSMKHEDQRRILWAIKERYKFGNVNEKLFEELGWLKSIQTLLLKESNHRKGKLSGYCLELLTKQYLNGVIEKLEKYS